MIFKIKIKDGPEIWGFGTFNRFGDVELKEGFHRYSIRHADEDAFEPCTLAKNIRVNHYGDIQTSADLTAILDNAQGNEVDIEYLEEYSSVLKCLCGVCEKGIAEPAIHKDQDMPGVYRVICKRCGSTIKYIRAANTLEAMQEFHKELAAQPHNKEVVEALRKVVENA